MLDKAKRPKFIVTGFVFSVATFVVFLSISFFYVYPRIKEIGLEKEDVAKKINSIKLINEKGITFSEFNELKTTYKANLYVSSLLKKTDESFFTSNFTNNKNGEDYNSFINKKINEVNKAENNETFKEIQESYKNILPTYVEDNYENEEGVMTDLKFVTYIESILYTFNLEMSNKNISIGNLNALPEYTNNKEAILDTTIFYIPYTFDITGKKSDILDFIYFLENVGSISINEEGNIEVFQDNFIKKTLEGFDNGNILKNQIIDIEMIKMTDYIDSGAETNNNEKLLDFIKRTQGNEKLNITLNVRFYVKGLPNYKIQEGIEKLNLRYQKMMSEYEKLRNKKDLTMEEKSRVNKAYSYLKELEKTISEIRKGKNDLNGIYKKVLEVNKMLNIIENSTKK